MTATTEYYCTHCGETHTHKCPKQSAHRAAQTREAQRRRRAKVKAEKAAEAEKLARLERENKMLRAQVARLERQLARARAAQGSTDILGVREGEPPKRAYRRVIQFLHPDRHGGHSEATRLTVLARQAFEACVH